MGDRPQRFLKNYREIRPLDFGGVPLRFLILTQYYPPEIGGAPTRLQSTAEHLIRSGHEVEVVTARPNYPKGKFFDGRGGQLYSREVRKGVIIHRVWLYPAVGGGVARMLNYGSFALTSMIGLFRSQRPDFLFVESPPLLTCIPAFAAKLFWRVPYIFNVSDLWPDAVVEAGLLSEGFLQRTLLWIESFAYRNAAYVNGVTQGIRDVLISKKHLSPEKALFLPNGADVKHFQPRDADLTLKKSLGLEGKKIVLWAGTMGYAQGVEFVLQAAKLLESRTEIHFLFMGDGSTRKSLEMQARELRLQNVTFRDPVSIEDLPPYYSIAECGLASLRVMPAHEGARPSKIFPVLASGRPLIFVGTGECARLIESAKAGVVVQPENPPALADEVLKLFSVPGLTRQLGENGRRYVEQHHDWSSLVKNWLKHLHREDKSQVTASRISATP